MLTIFILSIILLLSSVTMVVFVPATGGLNFMANTKVSEPVLCASLSELAFKSREYAKNGSGLSVSLIMSTIKSGYKIVLKKLASNLPLYDAEEILYENYHKICLCISNQKKYNTVYKTLPHINNVPRIFTVCENIVKSYDGLVTYNVLKECLEEYNSVTPLVYAEIVALPKILELALLELACILVSRHILFYKNERLANVDISNKKLDTNKVKFDSYVNAIFNSGSVELSRNLNEQCLINGIDMHESVERFDAKLSKYGGEFCSLVKTLYGIPKICCDKNLLELSPIYKTFKKDKSTNFDNLTLSTRHLYLREVYEKSVKQKTTELRVFYNAVEKSKHENIDVSHYILHSKIKKHYSIIYVAIFIFTVLGLCFFTQFFVPNFRFIVGVIFIPIAFVIIGYLGNVWCLYAVKRRELPSVGLKALTSTNTSVAIVVPRLIDTTGDIDNAFKHLHTIIASNSDNIFNYNLLFDYKKHTENEDKEQDKALNEHAKKLLELSPYSSRICVLVRARRQIRKSTMYQGWEKKRGALLDFNDAIGSDDTSAFSFVSKKPIVSEYAITLDCDTLINDCATLVGIMSHPYSKDKNVMSVNMSSMPVYNETLFSKLCSDSVGLSNYSYYLSSIEQDLFFSGNYTGKGIYRVKEFTSKLRYAFRDNTLLSHDYIEGCYAGASNTNVKALDEYPANFSCYLTRQMRWLKGDWQCIPFLRGRVKNYYGAKIKNPIPLIGKWHILFNLVSSLSVVSSFLLMTLSLFFSFPIGLIFLALGVDIAVLITQFLHIPKNGFKPFFIAFLNRIFFILLLPSVAVYTLYNILLTISRLIRQKDLLEWKTFAHSNSKVSLLPNTLWAIFVVLAVVIFGLDIIFVTLAGLSLIGIIANIILSQAISDKKITSNEFASELTIWFKKMYQYFLDCHNKENNYLPFDNYQVTGGVGFAVRTSPTNIGFSLVSHICAYELDIISKKQLEKHCNDIICSVEKLPKWHGNLYNWINVTSLSVLKPSYVSSVDSGNFLCALTLLYAYVDGELKERVSKLIDNTDIAKLFDTDRELFYVGYNEDANVFDKSHYDLMASESSLLYLMAIAHGKVEPNVWNNLSRQAYRYAGENVLASFTGGMFEYLMVGLFFNAPKKTVYSKNIMSHIRTQISYAKQQKLKVWGISESQYNKFDNIGNYQYKAFGVPNIALTRSTNKNIVSPYSSFLALPHSPKAVKNNLTVLQQYDTIGKYGFYESYCTDTNTPVKTFMAHHLGMSMAGICNYLTNNTLVDKLSSLPTCSGANLLLTACYDIKASKKKFVKPLKKSSCPQGIDYDCPSNIPQINLLSVGGYKLLVNQDGKGYSVYDKTRVTRYDKRDSGFDISVSVGKQKYNCLSGKTIFNYDSSIFYPQSTDINLKTKVTVLSSGNGECREVTLRNSTSKQINASLCCGVVASLRDNRGDITHKTYSDLFLNMEYCDKTDSLICSRKTDSKKIYTALFCVSDSNVIYNNDRRVFYKRKTAPPSVVVDPTEPILSAYTTAKLEPKEKSVVKFYMLCNYSLDDLKKEIKKIRFEDYEMREESTLKSKLKKYYVPTSTRVIGSKIMYASSGSICDKAINGIASTISPIVSVCVDSNKSLTKFKEKLVQLLRLYSFGIEFNLYIIYKEKYTYFINLVEQINLILDSLNYRSKLNNGSDVYLVDETAEIEKAKLIKKCSVKLSEIDILPLVTTKESYSDTAYPLASLVRPKVVKSMGIGGFCEDYSYFLDITKQDTPRAWSNIISNDKFGTLITESGGGYSFYNNASQKKISVWENDCILDYPSEFITLSEDSKVWSVTKKPCKTDSSYFVTHSRGYSKFTNNYNGFIAVQKIFIDKSDAIKYNTLALKNVTEHSRNINIMFALNPILGDIKANSKHSISISRVDDYTIKIFNATNLLSVYLSCSEKLTGFNKYKEDFTTRGSIVAINSDGSKYGEKVNKVSGKCFLTGSEVFASVVCGVEIEPYGAKNVCFTLSNVCDVRTDNAKEVLAVATKHYQNLSSMAVSGYSKTAIMSAWLPYQVYCSRFYGKVGLYQAGGAVGFRDQLQDCLTMLYINPTSVKEHILSCSKRQFEKGDVLHWYHKPSIGVRTKITDDRLFLPLVTVEYIKFTADTNILKEQTEYLLDMPIADGKHDLYADMQSTDYTDSLLNHCMKAIEISMDYGENGLCKMGTGDWNDAMDKIGADGKGTSVFVSMLLYYTIKKFLPFVKDNDRRNKWVDALDHLKSAINKAWDGEWYRRAYTDSGEVVGSKSSQECKIDLLTQSFATISGSCSDKKCATALGSVKKYLVDEEHGLVKLLTPPFKNMQNIGYIADYPLNVRENGGQYTHATAWYIISLIKNGQVDLAWKVYNMTSPLSHSSTIEKANHYANEPYVLSADIYAGDKAGVGGWSWYTGSASWYYRCLIENFYGIKLNGNILSIEPNLPDSVDTVELEIRHNKIKQKILIDNTKKSGEFKLSHNLITFGSGKIALGKSLSGHPIVVSRV